ncbi:MAG: hypothetical protein KAX69_03920 [Chitinophagales bacterium]|nr:hypothetical protein [Chitinophagales bacterium]HNY55525.1 hypothetical protein [Chitinophagales bacterium]
MNIIDDNDAGELVGEMIIQYRYQTDLYKAKYKVLGMINYENMTMYLEQSKLIYYDLLPKGYQWCFGIGTFEILRNPYRKKNYLDGYMTTNCGDEKLRMVLIKK